MNKSLILCLFASFFFIQLNAASLTTDQLRKGLSDYKFNQTLEEFSSDTSNKNEYWYWLDLARLQQINGDYKASIASFEAAYAILDEYENRASISMRNIGSFLGSSFLSKGSETYFGKGYERTLMHTLNALNYIMLGDFEGSTVEMRRMEQRQEFWLKESDEKIKQAAKDQAKATARNTDTDILPQNYSMSALLQNYEVRNLANNYQDPFSYALSHVIFEFSGLSDASGKSGDISLKRALALNPDVSKAFITPPANTLSVSHPLTGIDVTVVVLSGLAPSLKIEKIRFPIFHAAEYTSIDLPSYTPPVFDISSLTITSDKRNMYPPRLLKSDLMAYKTLQDEYSGEIAKSVVRATTKAIAAKQTTDHFGSLAGLLASLFMDIGSSVSDSGFRNWELLPNSGYLMKFEAKKGETITISLNNIQQSLTLPTDKKGVFILVSYLENNTIRIDHVTY